jgi:hypothetical protein
MDGKLGGDTERNGSRFKILFRPIRGETEQNREYPQSKYPSLPLEISSVRVSNTDCEMPRLTVCCNWSWIPGKGVLNFARSLC